MKILLLIALLSFTSAVVVNSSTQSFSKTVTSLSCSFDDHLFTVWRELDVKEVTEGGVTKYLSTITVHVRNDGGQALSGVEFRELVPDSIAKSPEELFSYSVKPAKVEEGSVVVTFLFDNFGKNEEKTVSYTVEKKVGEKALGDYEPPAVILKKKTVEQAANLNDFFLPGLVVLLLIAAVAIGWKGFKESV